VLAIQLNSNDYYHLARNYTGLKQTGELVIGKRLGEQLMVIAPLRYQPEAAFELRYDMHSGRAEALQNSLSGKEGSGLAVDYSGQEVLAAWRYIPELQWGMVAKIDTQEAFAAANRLKKTLIIAGLLVASLATIVGLVLARRLSSSLLMLVAATRELAAGNLHNPIHFSSSDEVGQLVNAFNDMLSQRQQYELALLESRDQALRDASIKASLLTERQQADEALRQAERQQREVLNNTSSMIYIKDLEGRYLFINRKCEEKMQLGHVQIVGKSDRDLALVGDPDGFLENDAKVIAAGKSMEFEETATGRKGEETYLSHKFPLRNSLGDIYAVCGVSTDITERIEHERELEHYKNKLEEQVSERTAALQESIVDLTDAQGELIRARQTAVDASRLKSEFLAHMSHEIRTPMNGVIGMADLLMELEVDEEKYEYASIIKQSGTTLLGIINDILDISKIEAGKLRIEKTNFSLFDLIGDINSFFGVELSKKSICYTSELDEKIPPIICSDATRIRQILINILGNAIKFTGAGGTILIRVECSEITLNTAGEDILTLRFSVRDSGIGIPKDQRAGIFEAFSQADNFAKNEIVGTGLGLKICQRLCQLLGGTIELESREGKGTIFSFSIDVTVVAESTSPASPARVARKLPPRQLAILLVEDNVVNQKIALAILRQLGFSAVVADNGRKAVDLLAEKRFDLVFMDCQMPVMDGYQATRLLRAQANLNDLPIVAMTASATVEERLLCQQVGMSDFIAKPIDIETVKCALIKWGWPPSSN